MEKKGPKAIIKLGGSEQIGQVGQHEESVPEEIRNMNSGMPLGVGEVVVAEHLASHEKELYGRLGIKPGDKIPGNFPEMVQAARDQAVQAANVPRVAVDPSTPPLKVETHDIRDLPPEAQKHWEHTLKQALQEFSANPSPPPRRKVNPRNLKPGVAEAIQAAEGKGQSIDFGDERIAGPPPSARPAEPPQAPRGVVKPKATPEPSQEEIAPNQATEPLTEEHSHQEHQSKVGEDALLKPEKCPYCHFNLKQSPEWEEPTKEEAWAFTVSTLAQQPYRKRYSLMGGKVVFEFRELTPDEYDLCHKQLQFDREEIGFQTLEEFWERLSRYRLYLQLSRVELGDNTIVLPECVDDWDTSGLGLREGETALGAIAEYIRTNVLNTSTLHRLAAHQCGIFTELVNRLEALTQDPDFYKETEG